jgi:hypothetical protein
LLKQPHTKQLLIQSVTHDQEDLRVGGPLEDVRVGWDAQVKGANRAVQVVR